MNDRTRTRLGRLLAGFAALAVAISIVVVVALGRWDFLVESYGLHNAVEAIGLGLIAFVALSTQPRNGAVWALASAAFFAALQTIGVATIALYEQADPSLMDRSLSPAELPLGAALAHQTVAWTWIPAIFILTTVGLQLFPDGNPLSSRWKWLSRVSLALIVISSVAFAWFMRPSSTVPLNSEEAGVAINIGLLALPLILVASGLSVVSVVVRYRRSVGVTRQQIRWIGWGGLLLVSSLVWLIFSGGLGGSAAAMVALAGEVLLVASIAIAMTRYRLYDIDIVISRTVTYGALALFITAVYVAIVVGVGGLFGQGDEPNLALAIVATASVAVLFEPIRSRVQRWANRLVYGDRATPYAVLSELTARLSEADSNEQALARMAELVASGTGAEEAVVWLRVGDQLRPEAATSSETRAVVSIAGNGLPNLDSDAAEPIEHGGELLGALSINKNKADPVTPSDQGLLEDVAAGAGLLLRNIRLNAELADRAIELRSSRRRLVAAQDSERRRLERNLHDGAQQQVVALKVKLGLAKTLAEREHVDDVAEAVGDLSADTQRAVDGMRAAARGIYPPLLEAEGLPAALVAAGRETGVPIEIDADGFGRYPPEIEATIYFSVLEAIGHASNESATVTRVSLNDDGEIVTFSVHHASAAAGRGPSFTAVTDRLEALGGALSVESADSGWTVVSGRVPATALERS